MSKRYFSCLGTKDLPSSLSFQLKDPGHQVLRYRLFFALPTLEVLEWELALGQPIRAAQIPDWENARKALFCCHCRGPDGTWWSGLLKLACLLAPEGQPAWQGERELLANLCQEAETRGNKGARKGGKTGLALHAESYKSSHTKRCTRSLGSPTGHSETLPRCN